MLGYERPERAGEYSAAMGQSLLLPACVVVVGLVAALFFARPEQIQPWNADVEPAVRTSRRG